MERVWDKRTRKNLMNTSESISALHHVNLGKQGSIPAGIWSKGGMWGWGFGRGPTQPTSVSLYWHSIPTLPTMHWLTLLTVLATFVSRQLLNPKSYPHTHILIYVSSFASSQLANYSCLASLSRFCLPFQIQLLHVRVGVLYLWFSRNTSDIISFPQVEILRT